MDNIIDITFPLDSLILYLVKCAFILGKIFSLVLDDILMDLLKNYSGKSFYLLWEWRHFHIHLCEEMVFSLPKGTEVRGHPFNPIRAGGGGSYITPP